MMAFQLMALAALVASAQASFKLISESDYIEAGSNAIYQQGNFTVDKCTRRCAADPMCQSFKFNLTESSCVLYHLRR
jgi:hypothetical protein